MNKAGHKQKRHTPSSTTSTLKSLHPYNTIEEQLAMEVESFKRLSRINLPIPLTAWRVGIHQVMTNAQNNGEAAEFFEFSALVPRGTGTTKHRVHLGLNISSKRQLITYCLVIGQEEDGTSSILRKVHFDIETVASSEPKPISHIQLEGGFPQALRALGYVEEDYAESPRALEKPRIPCYPPAFALLAHWAMLEYQSTEPDIHDFIRTREWISCVKSTEREVLHKYFEHGQGEIFSDSNSGSYLTSCYR